MAKVVVQVYHLFSDHLVITLLLQSDLFQKFVMIVKSQYVQCQLHHMLLI